PRSSDRTRRLASLAKPGAVAIRFGLPPLAADGVPHLVRDGQIDELVRRNPPLQEHRPAAGRVRPHQDLLQERHALLEDGEGWTVRIQASRPEDGLPVLGADEDPGPGPEPLGAVTREHGLEHVDLVQAGRYAVAGVAMEHRSGRGVRYRSVCVLSLRG